MSVQIVFPSAGHNIKDPGAVYNGRTEASEMICFKTLVVEFLNESKHPNIPDEDTETASVHQSRIKTGNGSVVCEFHLNASSNLTATGTEAVIKDNATANSKQMALELTTGTARILGIKNRGVIPESKTPRGRIGIVNKVGTSVLLELCFLSNTSDMAAFDQHKFELAKFIAETLIKFDNLI